MAPARGRPSAVRTLVLLVLLVLLSSAQAQQRLSRRRKPPIGGPNPPSVEETATGCLVTKPPSQGSTAYCERNVTRNTEAILCSRYPGNAFDTPPVPGKMTYRARDGNTRFLATDYRESCLSNAGVPCDAYRNLNYTNTLQEDNPSNSCCSCYLYAHHCAGNNGIPLKSAAGVDYMLDKKLESPDWHSLVMPKKPCTGVDNFNVQSQANGNDCPGEDVWNMAQSVIEDSRYNPYVGNPDCFTVVGTVFGAAINPVSRRGEHQMHVHVSRVWPSIISSIQYQYNVVYTQSGSASDLSFFLECRLVNGKKRRLDVCSVSPSSQPGLSRVKVVIKLNHATPDGAKPFEAVYGATGPPTSTADTTYTSMLVVRVPPKAKTDPKVWAIVSNPHGPAECFYQDNDKCRDS